jgi:hypothetical protein
MPLSNPADNSLRVARKTLTFDGTAGKGQVGAVPIFTTTGRVLIVALAPICTTTLVSAGGGTIALGVTGSLARFIAATTATGITTSAQVWTTTTPSNGAVALPAAMVNVALATAIPILGTVATAAITAGVIEFECYYRPLSADGALA